jgi:hypothetical protein
MELAKRDGSASLIEALRLRDPLLLTDLARGWTAAP